MEIICQKANKTLDYIGGSKTLNTLKELDKDNEKIIELMEQNVELNQLRTTLAKQIGDRIISPK